MRQLLLLLPLLICASCINFTEPPQTHYYLLEAAAALKPISAENRSTINIRLSAFPELLERTQMVLKDQKNMVRILTYERWADPLDVNIQAVIRDNLQQQLPNARISAGLWEQDPQPEAQVTIQIKQFIGEPGATAQVELTWQYSVNGKELKNGRFSDRQQAGASIQEMVGVLNRSLNCFSMQLGSELKL
jgi:uncharacterized lipoprotein YmbA